MFHYLAPYVGAGTDDDAFRPRGSEQPGWAAVDFRPNCTVLAGRAIIAVPVRDDTIGAYLGDAPDEVSTAVKSAVESRFGITLAATRLRQIVPELLITHAREDGTRWRPLRAMRDGMFRIYLGGLWWQARSLSGGSTITESFNTADSATLGPDLSWTELAGDIDIVSNQARTITQNSQCIARADTDLASSDHYVQAIFDTDNENNAYSGLMARKDSSATLTFYLFSGAYNENLLIIYKCVAGTFTTLGANIAQTLTGGTPGTLKGSVNGSSLEIFLDGVSKGTRTDTAITGNLRTGLRCVHTSNPSVGYVSIDSFEAGDLQSVVPVLMRHYRARKD